MVTTVSTLSVCCPSTPHFLSFILLLCLSLYAKLNPPSLPLCLSSPLSYHIVSPLHLISLLPASASYLLPILLSFSLASVWCIPGGCEGPEGSMNKSLTLAPQTVIIANLFKNMVPRHLSHSLCTPLSTSISNENINK